MFPSACRRGWPLARQLLDERSTTAKENELPETILQGEGIHKNKDGLRFTTWWKTSGEI